MVPGPGGTGLSLLPDLCSCFMAVFYLQQVHSSAFGWAEMEHYLPLFAACLYWPVQHPTSHACPTPLYAQFDNFTSQSLFFCSLAFLLVGREGVSLGVPTSPSLVFHMLGSCSPSSGLILRAQRFPQGGLAMNSVREGGAEGGSGQRALLGDSISVWPSHCDSEYRG